MTARKKSKPVLGLTLGDPAGVGPELCLRALREPSVLAGCVPVLFGDAAVLQRLQKLPAFAGKKKGASAIRIVSRLEDVPVINEPLIVDCAAIAADQVEPGKVSAACGRAAYVYIERAIAAALAGRIAGVVTAPINKESLHLAGVKFPGHTEIFTALTGAKFSCMMLYSEPLTVSMVTTHIGYYQVPAKLTVQRVLNVIELTASALRRMRRREPRLGICGLNPHAGEHGLFGRREEEKSIIPAIRQAREQGICVDGPLVPDAAFTANVRKKYDAIVTLYHDQGHIPFKLLAFDTGVNLTLGLPIVRTSVDHGTAFDIAWQGQADPQSLFSAIRVAVDLAPKAGSNFRSAPPASAGRHGAKNRFPAGSLK
jgi:4-hydroxythreonine-4-phosphate dehydrogenase